VIALCRALVDAAAGRRPADWPSISGLQESLGVTMEEMDGAVAYSVANGLVCADGTPPRSLTVTYEGIALARRP
jgi:hypothetical protein